MTNAQRLALRASEIRTRLSALAAINEQTEETRSELDSLRIEYADLSAGLRRSSSQATNLRLKPRLKRSTAVNLRALIDDSNIGPSTRQQSTTAALTAVSVICSNISTWTSTKFRFAMLETRAVTSAPSEVGEVQQGIIPYVFPDSAAAFIGVDMPTVAVGEAVFPVLTSVLAVRHASRERQPRRNHGIVHRRRVESQETASVILLQQRRPGPVCRNEHRT